jgi:hypothetical protein
VSEIWTVDSGSTCSDLTWHHDKNEDEDFVMLERLWMRWRIENRAKTFCWWHCWQLALDCNMYRGRSTSINISGTTEEMSWYPKWGSVLERSSIGYVWYGCGSVEPSVRGGCVSELSRSDFNWNWKQTSALKLQFHARGKLALTDHGNPRRGIRPSSCLVLS